LFALAALLLLASCTPRDNAGEQQHHDGFYGGVSAGAAVMH
jgi:hypothetical protein